MFYKFLETDVLQQLRPAAAHMQWSSSAVRVSVFLNKMADNVEHKQPPAIKLVPLPNAKSNLRTHFRFEVEADGKQ